MQERTQNKLWHGVSQVAFCAAPAYFSLLALTLGGAEPIVIKAKDGQITEPFLVSKDAIVHSAQSELVKGGRAIYQFTTVEPGTYVILAALKGSGETNIVLHVGIDKEEFATETDGKWQFTAKPVLQSIPVGCRSSDGDPIARGKPMRFNLVPGTHKLLVQGRTAGVEIESFTLQRTPAAPGAPRITIAQ